MCCIIMSDVVMMMRKGEDVTDAENDIMAGGITWYTRFQVGQFKGFSRSLGPSQSVADLGVLFLSLPFSTSSAPSTGPKISFSGSRTTSVEDEEADGICCEAILKDKILCNSDVFGLNLMGSVSLYRQNTPVEFLTPLSLVIEWDRIEHALRAT